MTDFLKNFCKGKFEEREITTKEYRLMYYYGVWMTSKILYAECDAKAIFDARNEFKQAKATYRLPYALWCGNRLVKRFNYEGAPYKPHFVTA